MRYFPHTDEDITAMLQVIGAASLDELFAAIPKDLRRSDSMRLPEALTEWELNELMDGLARQTPDTETKAFIGAGCYAHYIPAAVASLAGRSEFVTAYTPYQPEMSQGTLQAIYEYQTLTARLLGMEVANASLYDGASALAEALLMAIRITKKSKAAVSSLIHPHYRQAAKTYFRGTEYEIIELPRMDNGRTDFSGIARLSDLACVAIQSPNFFGCIEDIQAVSEAVHQHGALSVVCFTEPLAYGLLKSPGTLGTDIACGEGRSFGIPMSFGGPGVGMFASHLKYVRSMPGRLVGQTKDRDGKRAFVLTLSTREQHIRREKATSNICTNSSLCALTAAMYMASIGGTGLKALARLNRDKAEFLKTELKTAGLDLPFSAPTFHEFVVKFPQGFETKWQTIKQKGIIAGLPLTKWYPDLAQHYLLCVTEVMKRSDMERLIKEVLS